MKCQALIIGAVECPKNRLNSYPFCAEHMNSTYDVTVIKDNRILERLSKQSLVNVNFTKNISIFRNRKQDLCLKIKDPTIKCFKCLDRQNACLKHNTNYLERQYIHYDIKAIASLLPDGFPVGLIKETLDKNSGDLVETVMQLQDRKNIPLCNIVICAKNELSGFLSSDKWDNIISINKKDVVPSEKNWKIWLDGHAKNVLCLYFDDSRLFRESRIPRNEVILDHQLDNKVVLSGPKPGDIEQVMLFAAKVSPSSKTLIHCQLGMLRSPAVAMILMMEWGMTLGQAGNMIKLIRPNAKPSLEILKMYREIKNPPKDGKTTRSGRQY